MEQEVHDAAALPGLDLDRFGTWLASQLGAVGTQLSASLITGGKSNLTYEVSDGSRSWILRRPPVGELAGNAHDMRREYRVISALKGTTVPVPVIHGVCEDPSVLGAPFYLMAKVPGHPYRYAADLTPLGPARTRAISESLIDVLVQLHRLDPHVVGLDGFGRSEGFLARQVERWHAAFGPLDERRRSGIDELHARLRSSVPVSARPGIVHGDFRLDNVLVDHRDRLLAVIDWEMSTIGDPLTDLALMLVYARLAGKVQSGQVFDAASAPGYLSEDEILDRYATQSDRDLSEFGFYLALASFKLAGVLEGISQRHLNGQTVGDGFDEWGAHVPVLIEAGLDALEMSF